MPHTPGPWTWEPIADGCDEECLVASDGTVVVSRDRNDDGDDVLFVHPSDKPTIAAAPEMYALLKECEWVSGVYESPCPICLECSPPHRPDCRLAAVLKAVEGEENA